MLFIFLIFIVILLIAEKVIDKMYNSGGSAHKLTVICRENYPWKEFL